MDFSHKKFSDYLLNTNNAFHKLSLLDSKNKEILSFDINFGNLKFIAKNLSSAQIYTYPFIFFEFSTGIFTTKELYDENNEIIDSITFNKINFKSTEDLNLQRRMTEDKYLLFNGQNRTFKFQNKNSRIEHKKDSNKINQTFIQNFQMYHYFSEPNLKNEQNEEFIDKRPKNYIKFEELMKKKRLIDILKEKLKQIKEKTTLFKEINKQILDITNEKNKNVSIAKITYDSRKSDYLSQKNSYENEIKKIGKYNFVFDTLVNKKIIEIIFAFFNQTVQSLYYIPDFYNEKIITSEHIRNETIQNKSKENKEIRKLYGAMMGNVANLINYISKSLNIPFKYPFFVNGSKSLLIKSKKNFLQLFLPDDKVENFISAIECVKVNLREIINFLSTYINVINEKDYEKLNEYQTWNFFKYFVEFTKALHHFVETIPEYN